MCERLNVSLVVFRWCAILHALQRRLTLQLLADTPRFFLRASRFLHQLADSQGSRALQADRVALSVEENRLTHWASASHP